MNEKEIICSCFEIRKTKGTGRKQRRHGRMTLRGSVGVAGRVRYKCSNRHCGRTVHLPSKYRQDELDFSA